MTRNPNRLRKMAAPTNTPTRGIKYVLAAAFFLTSLCAVAQDATQEDPRKDRYRVELLLFTLKDPTYQEHLEQADAPSIPENAELLFGQRPSIESETTPEEIQPADPEGQPAANDRASPITDFSRTFEPTDNLHLSAARNRLRNSGRYNIEFYLAWNEAFPPGHKTPPLVVRVGDTKDGYSDIEGYIQIERQRYLHVTAQLYDLNLEPESASETSAGRPEQDRLPGRTAAVSGEEESDAGPLLLESLTAPDAADPIEPGPEVVTWMRETRRMRSGEVHLLDSPTMGLLVYFEPLD